MGNKNKGLRGWLTAVLSLAFIAAFLGGLYLLPDLWERRAIGKLRSDESAEGWER